MAGSELSQASMWSWWVKSKRAQSNTDDETWIEGGVSPTLNAFDQGDSRATVIAFSHTQGLDEQASESARPTLRVGGGGQAVLHTAVRRLTPVECERLQGFPDNWTAGQADSHRYRQMGNAVTVNVAHYLGTLLQHAAKEDA